MFYNADGQLSFDSTKIETGQTRCNRRMILNIAKSQTVSWPYSGPKVTTVTVNLEGRKELPLPVGKAWLIDVTKFLISVSDHLKRALYTQEAKLLAYDAMFDMDIDISSFFSINDLYLQLQAYGLVVVGAKPTYRSKPGKYKVPYSSNRQDRFNKALALVEESIRVNQRRNHHSTRTAQPRNLFGHAMYTTFCTSCDTDSPHKHGKCLICGNSLETIRIDKPAEIKRKQSRLKVRRFVRDLTRDRKIAFRASAEKSRQMFEGTPFSHWKRCTVTEGTQQCVLESTHVERGTAHVFNPITSATADSARTP